MKGEKGRIACVVTPSTPVPHAKYVQIGAKGAINRHHTAAEKTCERGFNNLSARDLHVVIGLA